MRQWIWLVAAVVLLTGRAEADTFDLTLNDYSAQVSYGRLLAEDEFGRSVLRGRVLFNDKEETLLSSVGFDFSGSPGNVPGLDLVLGAELLGGRADRSRDLLGLGVGGGVNYLPPFLGGVNVGAKLFYIPGILAFLEAERMLESSVRVGYAVTPRARLHLEYQIIRADVEDGGNWTIDEGVRVGFEARF